MESHFCFHMTSSHSIDFKKEDKRLTLVFNTMLQTFNTTNRKIPEQYQSLKHFISVCIRTNILLFKYLHITSWVMSTRHISGFLSWPSYTMGWSEKKKICSVTIQQLKSFDLFGSAFFKWRINQNEVTFPLILSRLALCKKINSVRRKN